METFKYLARYSSLGAPPPAIGRSNESWCQRGYGSIAVKYTFLGMDIYLPVILMWTDRVWTCEQTHPQMEKDTHSFKLARKFFSIYTIRSRRILNFTLAKKKVPKRMKFRGFSIYSKMALGLFLQTSMISFPPGVTVGLKPLFVGFCGALL